MMSMGYWVTLACAWLVGGLMLLAVLVSRNFGGAANAETLRIYERGAGRPLHPEVAVRSVSTTAAGLALGMIIASLFIFLPWPRALLFMLPLWIPFFGGSIGYVVGWRLAQKRALAQARAAGELQVDLSRRETGRYLNWPYLVLPLLLIAFWTLVLLLFLSPGLGHAIYLSPFSLTQGKISLTWLDILLAPAVALLVALAGWWLLNQVSFAPKALSGQHTELAAKTDDLMRRETITHTYIGVQASMVFLLLGPTSLIQQGLLKGLLSFILLVFGIFVLSPRTLFDRWLFKKRHVGNEYEEGRES